MSLEQRLTSLLATNQHINDIAAKDIIPLIDLTLLDPEASSQAIYDLAIKADKYRVAAICVYPNDLVFIPKKIEIQRAAVVNFPTGDEPLQQVINTIEQMVNNTQLDEIDYVFPYKSYLAGEQLSSLSHCHAVSELCKAHNLRFKVILETGALPSIDVVYELSKAIINEGCDFIKTSTGKIAEGATIPAVFAMLAAIVDTGSSCGVKVSGGVKTPGQAFEYAKLAERMLEQRVSSTWFRIGASVLLDVLIK